jgi:hypothetical protein
MNLKSQWMFCVFVLFTQRYGGMSQNVTQSFGGVSMGSDSSLAPGHISIRATVGASFALE